jgi:DNA-binding CsgD family transcriptional regulator
VLLGGGEGAEQVHHRLADRFTDRPGVSVPPSSSVLMGSRGEPAAVEWRHGHRDASASPHVLRAPGAALDPLRRAWTEWQRLEAPYDAARARLLIGCAYRDLGDEESAAMELDAARWVFQQLGALPGLARIDALLSHSEAQGAPGGLTPRELDVLRLIAAGQTNKEIGATLVISEHTVARHVQNMLAKLGCPSRAALAAFAVEHHIAQPPHTQL